MEIERNKLGRRKVDEKTFVHLSSERSILSKANDSPMLVNEESQRSMACFMTLTDRPVSLSDLT